jgi:hypothetical protein
MNENESDSFAQMMHTLSLMNAKIERIIVTEQQVKDALSKVDLATNQIAANVSIVAALDQNIANEIIALKQAVTDAQANGDGVSQELVDMADALATKAQTSSDALTALIKPLQDIASSGENPVPTPVPPPTSMLGRTQAPGTVHSYEHQPHPINPSGSPSSPKDGDKVPNRIDQGAEVASDPKTVASHPVGKSDPKAK